MPRLKFDNDNQVGLSFEILFHADVVKVKKQRVQEGHRCWQNGPGQIRNNTVCHAQWLMLS